MRKAQILLPAAIFSIILALFSCTRAISPESTATEHVIAESPETTPASSQDIQEDFQIPENAFSLAEIPPYTGEPYAVVNGNIPYFSEGDLTDRSYESYSELDDLGRCGAACACIGLDIMPAEERGSIGQIKPSGWHTVKYDIIDGNYLYNRCHLIGYQLSGENSNEKNLITGTRYMNVSGMSPFENMAADYVRKTGNHVLYRVTPVFEEDNLLASGVLMEAESVEDKGAGILFCAYVYNVQPGIVIDYATGESSLDISEQESSAEVSQGARAESENIIPAQETIEESIEGPSQSQTAGTQEITYILNTNTKKFHYPSCSSVSRMKESNKKEFTGGREDAISQGYEPCGRCKP